MVKFLAVALLAMALAPVSSANKLLTNELNNMIESGMIDKDRLLRKAVPIGRDLQNNNNGGYSQSSSYYGRNNNNNNNVNGQYNANNANKAASYYYNSGNNYNENGQNYNSNVKQYYNGQYYQENVQYGYDYSYRNGEDAASEGGNNEANQYSNLPYNGNYTVRFNKCLSFAIEDEDIIQDTELIYYANTGVVVSQKSYILFDIQECQPGSCVFDESDLSKIHIVALEDFIDSFIEYFPTKKEAYCQQCMNHYSYCSSQEGNFFDNAVFRNGGSFCYGGQQYAMINCKQCWEMGCLDEGYEDGLGDVNEWIESMAGCKQTNTWWKSYPLYTGLTCNSEGDGVEFGVFLDETCKTYHRQKAFRNVIGNDDWQMLLQTPSLIEYMFTSSMTCKDETTIKYMNAFQPVYGNNGNGNGNANGNANSNFASAVAQEGNTCQLGEDVNESCLNLFQENSMGYSLADCLNQVPSWSGSNNNNNNNNDNNQEDAQDETEDIDAEWVANSLYRYELSASDLNDMGKVCHLIANKYAYYASGGSVGALVSSYGKGQHTNVFNEEGSGSMFDYNTAKNNYYSKEQYDRVVNSWGVKASRMTLAEKLTFIFLGIGTFFIIIGAVVRWCKSRQSSVEFVDKGLPLMD